MLYIDRIKLEPSENSSEFYRSALALMSPTRPKYPLEVSLALSIRTDKTNEVFVPNNSGKPYRVFSDLSTAIPFDDSILSLARDMVNEFFNIESHPDWIFRTALIPMGTSILDSTIYFHNTIVLDCTLLTEPNFKFHGGKFVPIKELVVTNPLDKNLTSFLILTK